MPVLRLASLAIVFVSACVSSNTALQTAPTVPSGDVQVSVGASVPVSSRFAGEIAALIDQSVDRLEQGMDQGPITEQEHREAIQSAMAILVLQPVPVTTLSMRAGLAERIDAGLRLATAAIRLDGKLWVVQDAGGVDASLIAGVEHHTGIGASIAGSIYDLFDSLRLLDYSRRDLELGAIISRAGEHRVVWYGAARYRIGFMTFETELDELVDETGQTRADTSERLHLLSGTAGARIGTSRASLSLELTLARMLFSPQVLGAEVDLGGWLVEPGLGASLTW